MLSLLSDRQMIKMLSGFIKNRSVRSFDSDTVKVIKGQNQQLNRKSNLI